MARLALVAVAGLLVSATPPAQARAKSDAAAETTSAGKPLALVKTKKVRSQKASRAKKTKYVARQNARKVAVAAKQARARAAAERERTAAREKDIPEAVANANALMTASNASGGAAMSGPVPLEAAATDQLNQLSQALATPPPEDPMSRMGLKLAEVEPSQTVAPEAAQAAAPPPPVVVKPVRSVMQITAASADDPWEQSSTIGKLFIALGGLLTLASAARMLIA